MHIIIIARIHDCAVIFLHLSGIYMLKTHGYTCTCNLKVLGILIIVRHLHLYWHTCTCAVVFADIRLNYLEVVGARTVPLSTDCLHGT